MYFSNVILMGRNPFVKCGGPSSFPSLQIDGILHFEARDVLPQWDKQIQSLCFQVNGIIEKINVAHPEWVAKVMDEQMVQ